MEREIVSIQQMIAVCLKEPGGSGEKSEIAVCLKEPGGSGEKSEDVERIPSSDPISETQATKPKDIIVFVNLVDFCRLVQGNHLMGFSPCIVSVFRFRSGSNCCSLFFCRDLLVNGAKPEAFRPWIFKFGREVILLSVK